MKMIAAAAVVALAAMPALAQTQGAPERGARPGIPQQHAPGATGPGTTGTPDANPNLSQLPSGPRRQPQSTRCSSGSNLTGCLQGAMPNDQTHIHGQGGSPTKPPGGAPAPQTR